MGNTSMKSTERFECDDVDDDDDAYPTVGKQ